MRTRQRRGDGYMQCIRKVRTCIAASSAAAAAALAFTPALTARCWLGLWLLSGARPASWPALHSSPRPGLISRACPCPTTSSRREALTLNFAASAAASRAASLTLRTIFPPRAVSAGTFSSSLESPHTSNPPRSAPSRGPSLDLWPPRESPHRCCASCPAEYSASVHRNGIRIGKRVPGDKVNVF